MRFVEKAYNPPVLAHGFSEADFGREWHGVRTELLATLKNICPKTRNFDDCVVITSDWGLSRHIQFEVRDLEFLKTPGLAKAIRMLAEKQDPTYEFLLEHDLYLDDQWPDCAVLFRADETVGYESEAGALFAIKDLSKCN